LPSDSPSLQLIRDILDRSEDTMPGQRYQDPAIEVRKDSKRPYYQIRPYVPIITSEGLTRKQQPIRLGFCDEMTMRDAKSQKQMVMATINDNKFLVQSQIPFSAVLDRYEEVRLPQIPASREAYANHIKNHIRPHFSFVGEGKKKRAMRMCDIDKSMVEAWLNQKAAIGLSHNTLLDIRKVLSAIFTQAQEWNYWKGDNPCWRLKGKIGGKTEVYNKRLPKADELLRFLGAIEDTCIIPAEGARAMAMTSISIGTRICEVLGLQPNDIDPESETIKIQRDWVRGRVGPTKTPESKRTRQSPGIAKELLAYARAKGVGPEGFIFGRPDRGGNPPDDRDLQHYVFGPAAKRAGIYTVGFGLRRFRGLNISWRMSVGGAQPLEAQKAAGHTRLSTTWLYTQNEEDRDRSHVQAIVDKLQGVPEGGIM